MAVQQPVQQSDLQVILAGGWAQPESALLPLQRQLAVFGRVHAIILDKPEVELQAQLGSLVEGYPGRTLFVGWSLGGNLLLRTLTSKAVLTSQFAPGNKLAGIVLIACNPCFIGDSGWPGVGDELFREFELQLQNDTPALLNKFLKLQLLGDPQYRTLCRALRPLMADLRQWPITQLSMSLGWLRSWDCRILLQKISKTVLIFGKHDRLVPVELAEFISKAYPQHQVITQSNMAHYPRQEAAAEIVQRVRQCLAI